METPVSLLVFSWIFIMCTSLILMLKRTVIEDYNLREKFGLEWDAYRSTVPYALIPYIY